MSFTEEELKGVPKDVVSGYEKKAEDGKELYAVPFKTTDIFPVVSQNAKLTRIIYNLDFLVQIRREPGYS